MRTLLILLCLYFLAAATIGIFSYFRVDPNSMFGWPEWVGILNASAIGLGSLVAAWSVSQWRREQITRGKVEITEKAYSQIQTGRRILRTLRNSMISDQHGTTAILQLYRSNPDSSESIQYQRIIRDKIREYDAHFDALLETAELIQMYYGKNIRNSIEFLCEARGMLLAATQMMGGGRITQERMQERIDRYGWENILWRDFSDHDLFGSDIETAVKTVEKKFRSFLYR